VNDPAISSSGASAMKMTPSLFATGCLYFLLAMPAGGQDAPPVAQQDILRSQSKLKQIGLAFHTYESAYQFFPTDIRDKNGKALLSWRVAILPYIEEDKLFKEFKLDEPWDGEHNKKLIARMPKIYAPIRVKAKEGETFYHVFTGETALFGPRQKNPKIAFITDGTANTGLVFEAGEPVIWTRPVDMHFDEKKPVPKLGGLFEGECNVVLCDGSLMRLKKDADEIELKKLIIPHDGNVVDFNKLRK
jgi:hypothetical protein